jgi:hypothetical protein
MRSRRGWAHSGAALSIVVLGVGLSACAAILGFQEGVPLREGGADDDATTLDAAASLDGSVADALDGFAADGGPSDDVGSAVDARSDEKAPDDDAGPSGPCIGVCLSGPPDPEWQGPYAMFEVLDGAAPPSCDAPAWAEALDLNAGPDASPASCGCGCAPPTNVTCSAPQAVVSVNTTCATACVFNPKVTIGACTAVPPPSPMCSATARISFAPGTPDGGSCVATADVDAAPIDWAATARFCAPLANPGSCDAGACLPADPSGAATVPYCIIHPGTVPCPVTYPEAHAYGDGGTPYIGDAGDSRTCTCSCGAPVGLGCTAHVTLFDSGTCGGGDGGGGAGVVVEAGACTTPSAPAMEFASGVSTPADAGSCPPFGGPTGGLALTDSYTVCCTR